MITSFILQHQNKVESASLSDDTLLLEIKETVPLHEVFMLFADLVNLVRPREAVLVDPYQIRLEFDAPA